MKKPESLSPKMRVPLTPLRTPPLSHRFGWDGTYDVKPVLRDVSEALGSSGPVKGVVKDPQELLVDEIRSKKSVVRKRKTWAPGRGEGG